jgi:hypothetical protein
MYEAIVYSTLFYSGSGIIKSNYDTDYTSLLLRVFCYFGAGDFHRAAHYTHEQMRLRRGKEQDR